MSKKVSVIMIVILAVAVAGFLLWRYKFANTAKTPASSRAVPSISPVDLGKNISDKLVTPALPQTNPFGAQTNPFQGVYKNPFSK